MTDIEIARNTKLDNIINIAKKLDIDEEIGKDFFTLEA